MSPARFINAVFHSVKKCCAGTKDGCGESSGKKFNIPVHILYMNQVDYILDLFDKLL